MNNRARQLLPRFLALTAGCTVRLHRQSCTTLHQTRCRAKLIQRPAQHTRNTIGVETHLSYEFSFAAQKAKLLHTHREPTSKAQPQAQQLQRLRASVLARGCCVDRVRRDHKGVHNSAARLHRNASNEKTYQDNLQFGPIVQIPSALQLVKRSA